MNGKTSLGHALNTDKLSLRRKTQDNFNESRSTEHIDLTNDSGPEHDDGARHTQRRKDDTTNKSKNQEEAVQNRDPEKSLEQQRPFLKFKPKVQVAKGPRRETKLIEIDDANIIRPCLKAHGRNHVTTKKRHNQSIARPEGPKKFCHNPLQPSMDKRSSVKESSQKKSFNNHTVDHNKSIAASRAFRETKFKKSANQAGFASKERIEGKSRLDNELISEKLFTKEKTFFGNDSDGPPQLPCTFHSAIDYTRTFLPLLFDEGRAVSTDMSRNNYTIFGSCTNISFFLS